jgi:hypothetical protein
MFWFDGSLLLAAHSSASFHEGVEVRGEADAGFGESATGIEFGVVGPFVSLFIDAHSFAKSDHGAAEGADLQGRQNRAARRLRDAIHFQWSPSTRTGRSSSLHAFIALLIQAVVRGYKV